MNTPRNTSMTRREWLRLSAGTALALGLWPGCARFAGNGRGGNFTFAVINDAHFQSPRCPGWFEQVRQSLNAHPVRPEFCLMVGDLAEKGTTAELGGMRDALASFGIPFHAVMGNHDHVSDTDRAPWDALFPNRLNYAFTHRGWSFVGLDSSQGIQWQNTRISEATLSWLDDAARKLDPAAPMVVFTHFPLGEGVQYRPRNADTLLERLLKFNLVAVYNGHFHGFTERRSGQAIVTTNRCCSISRNNHDRSTEKGYFLCNAVDGAIERTFVEVTPG